MASSLLWKDLKKDDIKSIRKVKNNVNATRGILADLFDLDFKANKISAILLDYYYYNTMFAIQQKFTDEKISTFISIMKIIHLKSMEQVLPMEKSFTLFKQLLIDHSVHRPPYSVQIFSIEDVQSITDFEISMYFRHYKLYIYTFCKKQYANFKSFDINDRMEFPPAPKSLATMIPLEVYEIQLENEAQKKRDEEEQARLQQEVESSKIVPENLKDIAEQLSSIREEVNKSTESKIAELEAKVASLEEKLADKKKK